MARTFVRICWAFSIVLALQGFAWVEGKPFATFFTETSGKLLADEEEFSWTGLVMNRIFIFSLALMMVTFTVEAYYDILDTVRRRVGTAADGRSKALSRDWRMQRIRECVLRIEAGSAVDDQETISSGLKGLCKLMHEDYLARCFLRTLVKAALIEEWPDVIWDMTARLAINQERCCLCLDSYAETPSESVVSLPCHSTHIFHRRCIRAYLIPNNRGAHCPICRQQLLFTIDMNTFHKKMVKDQRITSSLIWTAWNRTTRELIRNPRSHRLDILAALNSFELSYFD